MLFNIYSLADVPAESRDLLEKVNKQYGFIPNLFGVFAESPAAVQAYLALGDALRKAGLTAAEQQVALLATSIANGCEYCVAAHSAAARMPENVLTALRSGDALPDIRLEAIRAFTTELVNKRGYVADSALQAFSAAGYTRQNVLDVVTIVAMKTLSNYTNHIAETPLDQVFAPLAWKKL